MRRRQFFSLAAYVCLITLLWPSAAFAWGPAAHIDFGLEVLRNAAFLAPALRAILLRYPEDFLYGCCAADIVVGKNFAKELHHCHNWSVGLKMSERADNERRKALCFGFLSHLAADIVAHNFFVPYKSVESFRALSAKHTYWELRFDKTALARPDVWTTLRSMGRRQFRDHDEFLAEQLVDASRLFSFQVSRRIFASMMLLSRLKRWQQMIASIDKKSVLPLNAIEITDFRFLALQAILGFLVDLEQCRAVTVDPTGARSLRVAKEVRRELRMVWRESDVADEHWSRIVSDLRRRFRAGLYGRLDVPDVDSLVRMCA